MSRSAPDGPPTAGPADEGSTVCRYPGADWRLLVQLPGRVLTVALAGRPADPGVRVRSAVAGLEAIAAGRLFDSDLVRMVASAIYAESGAPERDAGEGEPVEPGEEPVEARGEPIEARGEPVEVLAACRTVVEVLGHRADPADSAAYRQWVQSVAARTAGPASDFVTDLGRALGLAAGV